MKKGWGSAGVSRGLRSRRARRDDAQFRTAPAERGSSWGQPRTHPSAQRPQSEGEASRARRYPQGYRERAVREATERQPRAGQGESLKGMGARAETGTRGTPSNGNRGGSEWRREGEEETDICILFREGRGGFREGRGGSTRGRPWSRRFRPSTIAHLWGQRQALWPSLNGHGVFSLYFLSTFSLLSLYFLSASSA